MLMVQGVCMDNDECLIDSINDFQKSISDQCGFLASQSVTITTY